MFVFERNSFFTRIGFCTLDAASEEEAAVGRALISIDQLISEALGNGLGVPESNSPWH